jgi:hypothetical protein
MTFIKIAPDLPTATKSIGSLSAPASIAVNQRMPCSSITHSGLTVNGSGQLVLSANTTFILFGSPLIEDNTSPYNATFECQWYDVTNSVYIGRPLKQWVGITSSTAYDRGSIARAVIYPTVSTTVEFRIKAVSASLDTVNPVTATAHWGTHAPYAGEQVYAVLSF